MTLAWFAGSSRRVLQQHPYPTPWSSAGHPFERVQSQVVVAILKILTPLLEMKLLLCDEVAHLQFASGATIANA